MPEQRRHLVPLPGGRRLEVAEAGTPGAPAVIVHNGTPSGAGLIAEHIADAFSRGLRIISYGRPGYGQSTRNPGRNVASAARDTAQLADALGIERFATWGISGGGPHALACAALLGDRVVAAASLASVAPYDAEGLNFLQGMGQDNLDEFGAAQRGEEALSAYLKPQVPTLLGADAGTLAEHMRTLLSPPDRAVFTGSFGEQLAGIMQDGLSMGIDGWADDDLAFSRPWGFSPSEISVPLQIWQGPHDLMVPFTHGEWLAEHVPQADVHLSPDDGHLTLYVRRVPEVHAWLASHF
ncbi:MAG: alpha/beta hydrolase [Thermaerobacter sp.]|nr:alpha/beta hydrolase [Thermaerobacter sp.]